MDLKRKDVETKQKQDIIMDELGDVIWLIGYVRFIEEKNLNIIPIELDRKNIGLDDRCSHILKCTPLTDGNHIIKPVCVPHNYEIHIDFKTFPFKTLLFKVNFKEYVLKWVSVCVSNIQNNSTIGHSVSKKHICEKCHNWFRNNPNRIESISIKNFGKCSYDHFQFTNKQGDKLFTNE